MKYVSPFFAVWSVIAAAQYFAQPSLAADKLNTAYISTTPGTSTVIQVAKDMRIFDKHGVDATVATFTILGMAMWLCKWYAPSGRLSPQDAAAQVADMALAALVSDR